MVEAPTRRLAWLAAFGDTRFLLLLIAGGTIALVVVFVVLVSNASFTQATQSKGNQFMAGAAQLRLSTTGPVVDALSLKPGDTRTGNVDVTNTGERASVSITVRGTGGAPALASALILTIKLRGAPGTVYYNGPLNGAGRVALGTYAPGATLELTFEITLPSGVDTSLGGKSLDANFEWEART